MSQQLAKRTACDRCRGQKLSCSNSGQLDPDRSACCIRCQRAGSQCITSGPKPLGRPRVVRDLSSSSSKSYRFLPSNQGRRRDERPGPRSLGTKHSLFPPPAPDIPGIAVPELGNIEGAMWAPGIYNDLGPTDPSWVLGQATASPQDLLLLPEEDSFPAQTAIPEAVDVLASAVSTSFFSPASDLPRAANSIPELQVNSYTTSAGLMGRLAHINGAIANQLLAAAAFPAFSALLPQSTPERLPTPETAMGGNHISKALSITSEFIELIQDQTTVTPHVIDGVFSSNNGLTEEAQPQLSTPAVLLILSGYTQLLQLYDVIFRRVREFLQITPSESIGECPGGSQAQFAMTGVTQIEGRLKIQIMVQVIEHQIDTVGRLLGVPSELCVSVEPPSPASLYAGKEREGLLSRAAFANLLRAALGSDHDCGSGDSSAKEVVRSLREAIGQVKGLIS